MATRFFHPLPLRPGAGQPPHQASAPESDKTRGLRTAGVCTSCNKANCNHLFEMRRKEVWPMTAPKKALGARKKAKMAMEKARLAAKSDVNMTATEDVDGNNAHDGKYGRSMVFDGHLITLLLVAANPTPDVPMADAGAQPNDSSIDSPPLKKRKIPKEFWPRKPPIFPPKAPYSGPNPLNLPRETFGRVSSASSPSVLETDRLLDLLLPPTPVPRQPRPRLPIPLPLPKRPLHPLPYLDPRTLQLRKAPSPHPFHFLRPARTLRACLGTHVVRRRQM